MSELGQLHAELDEQGIPDSEKNNALFERVSAGLKVAEKQIDSPKPTTQNQPSQKESFMVRHDKLVALVKQYATETHKVVTANGKNYVTHGVWQFLASATGLAPEFSWKEKDDGTVVCECTLYKRDNLIASSSVMTASKDEEFLKDKPTYAVYGMAQTRALSRAVKNIYGFIVEDAGFCATPLEEINDLNKKGAQDAK